LDRGSGGAADAPAAINVEISAAEVSVIAGMARHGVCPDIVFLISILSKDEYENAARLRQPRSTFLTSRKKPRSTL
jgi:hypothetical protein